MTMPGLALFYGGLVRSKNMLSVLMQVMVTFSLIVVLWFIYGLQPRVHRGQRLHRRQYRLFHEGRHLFDNGGSFAMAATFSKGVCIPELLFAAFQAFAGITCCLIVGAFAERIKFSAVLLFMALWFTFSYPPIAHMVWFWMGPDAYASRSRRRDDAKGRPGLADGARWTSPAARWCTSTPPWQAWSAPSWSAKRIGYGREAFTPHSLTLTMVGASLLWVGWFGFNAGSALEASNNAVLAFANTFAATAAAVLAWSHRRGAGQGQVSRCWARPRARRRPGGDHAGRRQRRHRRRIVVIGIVAGFACLWACQA